MQDVVDARCLGLQGSSELGRDAGRGDFLHLTVVLRIVVEELIGGDHLGDGEHYRLLLCLVTAHGDLGSIQILLNHHLFALHKRIAQGRCQLVGILHLRHTKAASVGSRLHEAGHAQSLFNLFLGVFVFLTTTQQNAIGHRHTEGTHVVVQRKLIERQRLNEYGTCGIRHMEQVEISLHDAILARCAVDGDIGIVEPHGFSIKLEREAVLVYPLCGAIGQVHMPVGVFHINDIDIVAIMVEERVESLCGAQRDVVF